MKKIIQICLVAIFGILVVMFAFDAVTLNFKMYDSNNHAYLVINNERYVTNNSFWNSDLFGRRIGFIESKLSFLNIFYTPFEHGVYEIEDSSGEKFYRVHDLFQDKQLGLFVKEDFDMDFPSEIECSKVVIEGYKSVTDSKLIDDLIFYLKTDTTYDDNISPAHGYNLRLYSKEFPSIYYLVEVLKSESDDSVWLSDFGWAGYEHVRIPNELFDKLTATPLP
ncbi:MAG TPA: hypothetical protein DCP62_00750 [Erysipelotrichaceae bacterium]|nr:hypothetical protein [Erysipelotrichaceae bacterium]HBZ42379.1 hypothetical protein [Erysipelotrichaceae bacterium]